MRRERPSSPGLPGDELNDSWFDRPGHRLRLPLLPPDPAPADDPDAPEELEDPWFVWSPDV